MRRLFADTFYWIALLNRRDRWNRRVVEVTASLGNHHLFTTDAVFDEFLAYYSSAPTHLRQRAQAAADIAVRSACFCRQADACCD